MSALLEWLLQTEGGLALLSVGGSPVSVALLLWLVARVEILHRRDRQTRTVVAKLVAGHTEGRDAHAALAETLRPHADN